MKSTPAEKKELQRLLRELVILRDKERCLKCGKTTGLQMSHIYPKGRCRKMEFDPENLKLLCVYHHLYWWHKAPVEAMEWLKETIDPKRLARLKMRANYVDKTPIDFNLLKLFLKQEIKKLST